MTHQHSIGEIIEKRTWVWIGHTLRKETAEDHEWNHQGLGKPESPKSSQRRSVTEEMTTFGTTAKYMKKGFTVKTVCPLFRHADDPAVLTLPAALCKDTRPSDVFSAG